MLLNYVPYFILPFAGVMTFTNNRVRFDRVWSMVDGFGIGIAFLTLIIFQLLWVLIDDIENASPAIIFDFLVWRVIIALAGIYTAWKVVSVNSLPGLPDLHHAAVADEVKLRRLGTRDPRHPDENLPLRATGRVETDVSHVGEWFSAVFSHPGWYAAEIGQFLLLNAAAFFFFFGNPEDAGDSTGAMILGMSLYAGATVLIPIIFYIILYFTGGGPMYGGPAVYKSLLFRRYAWWTFVNLVMVVIPAILQMTITHPNGWSSGTTSFFVWPFPIILILAGIVVLINFLVFLLNPGVKKSRVNFYQKYDALSEKQR